MKVEAHCGASLLGFVSDHRVVMILQVPREALEVAGMSINFRSGKFGYSICPIFSKGHADIFHVVMEAFFALSTREALEFAGMSINFRSGKFGYSICPIFSKGHAEIFREF